MTTTDSASYSRTAKLLHWLIAFAIIFMLALGWSFDFITDPMLKFKLFQLHKSIGITILLLSLARLCWRLTHRAPPLPASMPVWEKAAAQIMHVFLYAAMILMPLSGWIMVSASSHNIPTLLYGLVPWPAFPIAPENKEWVDDFTDTFHHYAAYVIAAMIVGHVGAALKHHFILRDDILLRMTPRFMTKFLNRLRNHA